ncbi:MAG TPA: hypothetical protein VK691_10635 [Solirubrobacteraceae bacterium]|nr:hypothetical protein [Solirubrobacteraceae bacterium]
MPVASGHVVAVTNYWCLKRHMIANRNNRYAPNNTNDEEDAPSARGTNPYRTDVDASRASSDYLRIANN